MTTAALYRETCTALLMLTPATIPHLPGAPLPAVNVRLVQPERLGATERDNELETLRIGAVALRLVAGVSYTPAWSPRYTLTPHAAERRALARAVAVRVTEVWVSTREDMLDASVETERAEEIA